MRACAGKDFTDRRDEALIRLLLDTGVRVSEACGLAVADVDLDREMTLVVGKGGKVRPVYFGARTTRALDRYLRERRKHRWAHLDALFLTQRARCPPTAPAPGSRSAQSRLGYGAALSHTASGTSSPMTS